MPNYRRIPETHGSVKFTLVALFLLASVFLSVAFGLYSPVSPDEAVRTEGTYLSFKHMTGRRYSVKNTVYLYFSDRDRLEIDSACVTQPLLNALNELNAGDNLELLVEPVSERILYLRSGEQEILSVDAVQYAYSCQKNNYLLMSALLYIGAVIAFFRLRRHTKPSHSKRITFEDYKFLCKGILRFLFKR